MKTLFKKVIAVCLRWEAKLVVLKYKPKIVAVTGSVGKTSTKDAIYSVIAKTAYVRKSEKSFNSEIGLPLTILGCPNGWNNPFRWIENLLDGLFLIVLPNKYPEWLVLEVGADRPGDIRSIASWLPVDVAVITRLPEVPVHVEYFDSAEEVVEEKASLINALKPDGTLVLYADDEKVKALAARFVPSAGAPERKVLTFGFSQGADIRAEKVELLFEKGKEHWPVGMRANIRVKEENIPVEVLGVVGHHALLSVLAAAAVGRALGMEPEEIARAAGAYVPPPGRMHLLLGVKETLIIDDTYNASPAAVEAALETLKAIPTRGRKIAVLGDMLELGKHSVDEHRKVGAQVAKVVDILYTVGFRARDIAQGALDSGMADGMVYQFEDSQKAGKELELQIEEGDCILVKGSQSIRTEHVVKEIMAEPERAGELLVRQDEEWQRR